MEVDNDKLKRVIEANVLINYFTDHVIERKISVFTLQYKLKLMYLALNKQFKTAKDVRTQYLEVAKMDDLSNLDFKNRLSRELAKFSGQQFEDNTTSDGLTMDASLRDIRRSQSPEREEMKLTEVDEVVDALKAMNGKVMDHSFKIDEDKREDTLPDFNIEDSKIEDGQNFNETKFKGGDFGFDKIEDEEQEDQAEIEERKKKEAEEAEWLSWYKDPQKNMEQFNPKKKFGVIEGQGEWVYDHITSSYPLNLPSDYYQRYVQTTIPKKEDGSGNWFVRPHHVENLTTHVRSAKDDVLNTRYYSHYENPEDPNKKKPELEEAVGGLEE